MAAKKKEWVIRRAVWSFVGIVIAITLALLYWNYASLQKAQDYSERASSDQARNYNHYVDGYKKTKQALSETTKQLVEITKELEVANVDLSAANGELTSVQKINDELQGHIEALEMLQSQMGVKNEELQRMIDALKEENSGLNMEMQVIRRDLAVFQPDVQDVTEGRLKLKLFKQQMRLVKKNMQWLKKKAAAARRTAQKERDRLEALYGNNGFLMKDGENQSVTDYQNKVNIDVKFVNP